MSQIRKIIIDDGATIEADFFTQDFVSDGVEEVWIENDFDVDSDAAVGFGCFHSLERVYIISHSSPYIFENGLLYINIGDEHFGEGLNRKNGFVSRSFFNEGLKGKVLVAIPPAHPNSEIVLPEGVVGICKGAIANCYLDSLTLPQSLKEVANLAIVNSIIKELKVPNWKSYYKHTDWVSANSKIQNIRSNIDGESLDEKIVEFWRNNLNTTN